jgi:hypothetical protein
MILLKTVTWPNKICYKLKKQNLCPNRNYSLALNLNSNPNQVEKVLKKVVYCKLICNGLAAIWDVKIAKNNLFAKFDAP